MNRDEGSYQNGYRNGYQNDDHANTSFASPFPPR